MSALILTLLAPMIGGLIYGLDRVIKARIQRRQGPPLLQPFYDMGKLMNKESFIVNWRHTIFGVAHFFTLWVSVGLIFYGSNLLYVIFLHLFSMLFLIIGAYSVRSAYSHLGANRELLTIVAYEPVLILVAIGFYLLTGSFEIREILLHENSVTSMVLLLLAYIFIIPIKLKKSPFDTAEAHQEIVGGVEIEYSGVFFEFIYMAKMVEIVFVYALLTLFMGANLIGGIALSLFVFILINIIDNNTARVNIAHTIKLTYTIAVSLALINLIWIAYV